jgi:putative transposase
METTNIVDFARRDGITDALTDLLRSGAQQLIATPVEAELAGYLAQFSDVRTEAGHAAVVRNGHHPAHPFQTGIGPMSVHIPKVRSMDGTPVTFRSALVPPYVRRTKTLEAALPWLYLKGISSGEMARPSRFFLVPMPLADQRIRSHAVSAIGPTNTTAGETQIWTINQSSRSGLTVFTAAFGARMTSFARL